MDTELPKDLSGNSDQGWGAAERGGGLEYGGHCSHSPGIFKLCVDISGIYYFSCLCINTPSLKIKYNCSMVKLDLFNNFILIHKSDCLLF